MVAGKRKTASVALFLAMKDMAVNDVLATHRLVAWAKGCWENEEVFK